MTRSIPRLFVTLLLLQPLGCGAVGRAQSSRDQPTARATPGGQTREAVIVLTRRADYFGVAPVYTLMIYADGGVAYIGTMNVRVKGLVRGRIDPRGVRRLLDRAREINFHSLLDEYGPGKGCPRHLADAGSAEVFILLDGKRKSILHDLGCSDSDAYVFPRELHALEFMIDQVVNSGQWVR